MGTFNWPLSVVSADGENVETVDALVDTGAVYTSLPASMLRRLGIVPRRKMKFELADGSVIEEDIGYAAVRVEGIEVPTIVVFSGGDASPLMGAYTLEGVGMAADPVNQRLTPALPLMLRSLTTGN
jgi:clan AA aspartic protease